MITKEQTGTHMTLLVNYLACAMPCHQRRLTMALVRTPLPQHAARHLPGARLPYRLPALRDLPRRSSFLILVPGGSFSALSPNMPESHRDTRPCLTFFRLGPFRHGPGECAQYAATPALA